MRTPGGTLRNRLLTALLALAVAMSVVFLLLVRSVGERQIQRNLGEDVERSLGTFRMIEQQRRRFLAEDSRLLADLPSLKALMTTADAATIQDGGTQYWKTSGSDLFALLSPSGEVQALYVAGSPLAVAEVGKQLRSSLAQPQKATGLFSAGRLFGIASSPIYFNQGERSLLLGYVVIGYEVDRELAHQVSLASFSEAVFVAGSEVVASTLAAAPTRKQLAELTRQPSGAPRNWGEGRKLDLGGEEYLASPILIEPLTPTTPAITLILFKPARQATLLLRQLNGGIAALGMIAVCVGAGLAFWLAGSVTRPLEALLESTRAFSFGRMEDAVPHGGPRELRELSAAFEKMRVELQRQQTELIASERLATIGRMASSVSHDLRHHLSPIYANAEFLGSSKISILEHGELLEEITAAAQGMTELLDSLLVFSRTGKALEPVLMPVARVIERAVASVKTHPAAHAIGGEEMEISVRGVESGDISPAIGLVDVKELQRAVYNLLLNACQAAGTSQADRGRVEVELASTAKTISIHVRDNGPGVPGSVRERLFQPFTSDGKENGIGLGLAIVKLVAEAHSGTVSMQRRRVAGRYGAEEEEWQTEFSIVLPAVGA